MSHVRRTRKTTSAQNPERKIAPLWRLCLGVAATAGLALIFEAHQLVQAINGYYFNRPTSSLTAVDMLLTLFAVYLLLVAASGRWRLFL